MLKFYTITAPFKITRIGQISTIIFNKGYRIPQDRVKRFLRHLKRPRLETPNIRAFLKMAVFPLKNGLKGVLRGRKGVVKIFMDFGNFWGFSQTPFFRFLNLEVMQNED